VRSARSIPVLWFRGRGRRLDVSMLASVTRCLGDSAFGLLRLDSLRGDSKFSLPRFSSRLLNTFSTGDVLLGFV
jgi:hypothetical protein